MKKARSGSAARDLFDAIRECAVCQASLAGRRSNAAVCSGPCGAELSRRRGPSGPRSCRVCSKPVPRHEHGDGNRQHCSSECARVSAKASRAAFHRRRPEADEVYRATQRAKKTRDTALGRLWKRWPDLPRACEACGESRVLDIAHRPEHARRGAWAVKRNCTPEMVWILCPTCHALLDRVGLTAEQLGIKPRNSVAVPMAEAIVRANVRLDARATRAA
jgi:hypothetical protein